MQSWIVLALAVCLPGILSYNMFQTEIPNGDQVPHPCKPNYVWHGVGHQNPGGGGARNPFGKDFNAHGRRWTRELCQADSDGDGKTNGQELGDPNCVWSKGQTPPVTQNITHPGVCDPWNAPQCVGKNVWLDCSQSEEFVCDAINEPEVMNITLRFPRTKVPAKETTYICFNFELPDDQEYHLIATKAYIDNKNVMHHIVMSGCTGDVGMLNEPQECLMGAEGCTENLGIWAVGHAGNCLTPEAGYLIGKGHTRVVSMQFHWTNPTEVDTWYDSSGMTLYYTPKLRRYNAGILMIGQTYLAIPPGQSAWTHKGGCSGQCTDQLFTGDIQLFSTLSHMHYLGIRQNVSLIPRGGQSQVIVDDNPYSYDSPVTHMHTPAITVRPGDELSTICTFQSRSRSKTTLYGEGSFEEMCFAFLSYYPKENVQTSSGGVCAQYKEADTCIMYAECNEAMFNRSNPILAGAIEKVTESCDPAGAECYLECGPVVRQVLDSTPCFKSSWSYFENVVYKYAWDPVLLKFVAAMNSCQQSEDHPMTTHRPHVSTARPVTSKPSEPTGPGGWMINLVKHLDARPLLQNIIMNVNYNNNYGAGAKADDHADNWH